MNTTLPQPIVAQETITDRLAVQWMNTADEWNTPRISRAADLVKAGSVERTAHPGRFLVVSQSRPAEAYLVDHGTCSCPDAAKRDSRNCKHSWAVRLACAAERADAEANDPTIAITVEPEDEAIPYTLGLRGRLGATPPTCTACHAEPSLAAHPDGLGKRCAAAELFGEEV